MTEPVSRAVHQLGEHKQALAEHITRRYFEKHAELTKNYGENEHNQYRKDVIEYLNYLHQAVQVNSLKLFTDHIDWARSMSSQRGVPVVHLIETLLLLKQTIQEKFEDDEAAVFVNYIEKGVDSLKGSRQEKNATFMVDGNPLLTEARTYLDLLLSGKRKDAADLIHNLVDTGTTIRQVYEHIFEPSQQEVGILWQQNKITVAHEHYCTAATQLIMSQLYPQIFSTEKTDQTMVACSVADELHEIGIRMVADFFEMEGWNTHYLGANMPEEDIVGAVLQHEADVLAISVTLPIHIGKAETLISALRNDSNARKVKVLVGGYPFQLLPDLWEKVGADGSAGSAQQAIEIANNLIKN